MARKGISDIMTIDAAGKNNAIGSLEIVSSNI